MSPRRVSRAKSGICTAAVFLVGEAAANVVLWMHGQPWSPAAVVATLGGVVLGGYLIHLGRCIEARPERS